MNGGRVGADLGATWLRVCLVEPSGKVLSARAAAKSWRRAPEVLRGLLRRWRGKRVDELIFGGTRLGGEAQRRALARRLRSLARRVRVVPDFELAHLAAFGDGPGVALLAGTGSVAFARDARGRTRRAGGLGPWFGDEGSGYWIGREAVLDERLRARLRLPKPLDLAHAEDPVRATAALAARVLSAARSDPNARKILRRASACLAALARESREGMARPTPLLLHGSLFKSPELKAAVLERLGRGWSLVRSSRTPERAVCHRAPGVW